MDFRKKRTLAVILLKKDFGANILMFHVFDNSGKDKLVLFSSNFSLQSLQSIDYITSNTAHSTLSFIQSSCDQNQSSGKRLMIGESILFYLNNCFKTMSLNIFILVKQKGVRYMSQIGSVHQLGKASTCLKKLSDIVTMQKEQHLCKKQTYVCKFISFLMKRTVRPVTSPKILVH